LGSKQFANHNKRIKSGIVPGAGVLQVPLPAAQILTALADAKLPWKQDSKATQGGREGGFGVMAGHAATIWRVKRTSTKIILVRSHWGKSL